MFQIPQSHSVDLDPDSPGLITAAPHNGLQANDCQNVTQNQENGFAKTEITVENGLAIKKDDPKRFESIREKLETVIDQVKTDRLKTRILMVGQGSAKLISKFKSFSGCQENFRLENAELASAIGAAQCHVIGSVETVVSIDSENAEPKERAIEIAKLEAINVAIRKGAVAESIKIISCTMLHQLSPTVMQYRIVAAGDLAINNTKAVKVNLVEYKQRAKIPPPISEHSFADEWSRLKEEVEYEVEDVPRGENAPFDKNGEWILSRYDIECVAVGAGILGCGGGGSTHTGKVQILHLLEMGQRARVVTVDRLVSNCDPEHSYTIATGLMGVPLACKESLQTKRASLVAIAAAVDFMENPDNYKNLPVQHFEGGVSYLDKVPVPEMIIEQLQKKDSEIKKTISIMPYEVGGINTMEPLAISASLGIPCVDADGTGRACPVIQMYTPYIFGAPLNPMLQNDDSDRITISLTTNTAEDMEDFHRHICVQNGSKGNSSYPGVKTSTLKSTCVEGAIARAWKVGKAVLDARRHKQSPAEAVVKSEGGKILCIAKIIDIQFRVGGGFQDGHFVLQDLHHDQNQFSVHFKNEYAIVRQNGMVLGTAPDLITILDAKTGEAIFTDDLLYGLKVALIVLPPPPMLVSEKVLPIFGPRGFGFDIDYKSFF